jgi:hypothetical protein
MRNTVAKALKNRVYGTYGAGTRDYQAKEFTNIIWATYKEGDHVRTAKYFTQKKPNKKLTVMAIAADLIPPYTTLIHAWRPIQIRDFGPRAIYKLAKRYYKRGQYKEMEALFK